MYIGTAVLNNDFQIKKCNLTVDFWKHYYMRERLQIFSIFNYHAYLIPLVQVIDFHSCTICNIAALRLKITCIIYSLKVLRNSK